MKPNDHANLLSIFYWIYAGVQTLLFIVIALYAGFFGYFSISIALEAKPQSEYASMFMGVIFLIFAVMLLIGLTSIILNIAAGVGLHKNKVWAKKIATAAAIGSILSFLCGGIWLLPFGVALGVYSLWFTTGEAGMRYFNNGDFGMNHQQPNAYQPPPNQYWQ